MSFFGRKLSIKGVAVGQATDKQLLLKEDYDLGNTLYYDTNGNPTVLLGNRTANTSNAIGSLQRGLFVSKAGINVTQAANSQLIFNSGQNVFKVVLKGSVVVPSILLGSVSSSQSTATVNFPTQQGIPLIVTSYTTDGASFQPWVGGQIISSAVTAGGVSIYQQYQLLTSVGNSSITFFAQFLNANGSFTWTTPTYTVYYYILQETLS